MATQVPAATRLRSERIFYGAMALAMLAAVFYGFARTYYLMAYTGAPPLSPLVHLHGIVFTAWFLFFLLQTSLVAIGRTDVHRVTGLFGAVLAAAVIVIGPMVAIEAGLTPRRAMVALGVDARGFLAYPLTIIVLFAAFVGLALANRRRPDVHKRLMLLATIAMTVPALARWQLPVGLPGPISAMLVSDLFLAAACLFDWRTRGRVHPVLVWGGLLYLVSQPLRAMLAHSQAWRDVAALMIG